MEEHFQVWDNYFGAGVYETQCPIRDCFNRIFRNNPCKGETNHRNYRVWEIDHEYPQSKGGTDDLSNKRPVCCDCNREKRDSTSPKWC